MIRSLRLLAFAAALACTLPARAATDYTDIWWTAGGVESGWGINLAQNGNSIFATFYVYTTSGVPVWYTALLTRTFGETFSGQVYASSGGAWFGSPTWVPPSATVAVGNATFVGETPYRGTLAYTIGGVPVSKTIERTTLQALNVAGTYLGGVSARRSGCGPDPLFDRPQFVITQTASPGTVRIDQLSTSDGSLICRMEGAGIQYGGVIDIPSAAYNCPGAVINATAHVIALRPTMTGFEGRWFSTDIGGGCTENGNFSGVTQAP